MCSAQHPGHPKRDFGPLPRRLQRGLTLVEVMMTTTISAILLGVAAPSFVDVLQVNRARSEAQELWVLLTRARAEAVQRNVPVLVCPSNDGASCLSAPTAGSWTGTKIACYDADSNGECDASTADTPNPIRVRNGADASVRLSGPTAAVRFSGYGTAASAVRFTLNAGTDSTKSSTVDVTAIGAVKVNPD